MLQLIGDIFNWTAAGVLFPLMLLPITVLIGDGKIKPEFVWIGLTAFVVLAGVAFVLLVPRLNGPGENQIEFMLLCGVIFALVLVGVFMQGVNALNARLAKNFERITTSAGRTVMWLLLVMALVQFIVVLLRYVFGINSLSMQESVTYMHGIVFLIAGGYALLTNDHVRVDIFYREASPKQKAVVDLLGTYLFLFPVCLLILWTASPYVARSWAFFEGSADSSGIQGVFLLKSLIPAFALLLSMAGFVNAHKAVAILKAQTD